MRGWGAGLLWIQLPPRRDQRAVRRMQCCSAAHRLKDLSRDSLGRVVCHSPVKDGRCVRVLPCLKPGHCHRVLTGQGPAAHADVQSHQVRGNPTCQLITTRHTSLFKTHEAENRDAVTENCSFYVKNKITACNVVASILFCFRLD